MWAVLEGTARLVDARAPRRAHADRRIGRGSPTAGTASLIGAIVAGGANSRFGGEPKGLHVVGGKRIIDRVATALEPVTSELILIASDPNATDWLPGVRVIPDAYRKQGSLVGIHTALSYARQPILIVAWDMPFVTRELLELLRDRSAGSTCATVPVGPGGLEPFCAVYTPQCLPWIESSLAADDLRLSNMFARLPEYQRVEAADLAALGDAARLFFNVNDASDLAAAERMVTQS